MPKPSASKWIGLGAALAAALAQAATPAPAPLKFDEAFRVRERGAVHYEATYVSGGSSHELQVWRDGATRVKRTTDGAIETYAVRKPGDAEFRMTVLDLRRKIATRVDRTNLYRIGHFSDWFDLAHALRHPRGDYALSREKAPAGAQQGLEPCQWFAVAQQGQVTHICWSAQRELPLQILAAGGQQVWKVTRVDARPIPATTFAIDDRGFVRNNANEDIERD